MPRQLPSAKGSQHQHYRNMNSYRNDGLPAEAMHGAWWQIDEEIYDYFMGMLPPIYVPGGFAMCERLTGDLSAFYWKLGTEYVCCYTLIGNVRDQSSLMNHIGKQLS